MSYKNLVAVAIVVLTVCIGLQEWQIRTLRSRQAFRDQIGILERGSVSRQLSVLSGRLDVQEMSTLLADAKCDQAQAVASISSATDGLHNKLIEKIVARLIDVEDRIVGIPPLSLSYGDDSPPLFDINSAFDPYKGVHPHIDDSIFRELEREIKRSIDEPPPNKLGEGSIDGL